MTDLNIIKQLELVYSSFKTRLTLKKKFKADSVLASIISVTSNEAYKMLSESGFKPSSMPKDAFDLLLAKDLIRMAERQDKYVITAKGVWEIESKKGVMNTDILLQYLDNKFFDLFGEGGQVTEKDKVILLTMIAIRSFSKESALDLKKGEIVLKCLQSLIESSFEFLLKYESIKKLKLTDLLNAKGNEDPVYFLYRHTDSLLKKTRGIYKTLGKQKYYLDLFDGIKIVEESLIALFGYVFGSKMTTDLKIELSNFCLENAYSKSSFLFNLNEHHFANPIYDRQFDETLEKYYAVKYKFETE